MTVAIDHGKAIVPHSSFTAFRIPPNLQRRYVYCLSAQKLSSFEAIKLAGFMLQEAVVCANLSVESLLRWFGEKHQHRRQQAHNREHAECNCVALRQVVKKAGNDGTQESARGNYRPAHALNRGKSLSAEIVGANRFL